MNILYTQDTSLEVSFPCSLAPSFPAQSLPRSLPPSRRPCLAPFLPRLFPSSTLPPSTLPSSTDASCLCSILASSLPPLTLSLPPSLPPSPCSLSHHHLAPSLLSLPPLVPSPTITLLPPSPSPPLPLSLPYSILPRPFPVSHHRFLPPSRPLFPPSLQPSILPRSFPAPRCLLASCRATQYTLCVYTVLASCTGYCLGRTSHAWRWDNGVVAPSAGGSGLPWQRTPTANPFFTNSNKSDGRNMLQTHINTVEARTFPTVYAATPRAR